MRRTHDGVGVYGEAGGDAAVIRPEEDRQRTQLQIGNVKDRETDGEPVTKGDTADGVQQVGGEMARSSSGADSGYVEVRDGGGMAFGGPRLQDRSLPVVAD